MLLEIRFHGLRFRAGCRVDEVYDRIEDSGAQEQRVWGWRYRTLAGHFEQGEMHWEVRKSAETGEVEFALRAQSRRARDPNPLVRIGFRLVGRREQLRFYDSTCERMRRLTAEALGPGRVARRSARSLRRSPRAGSAPTTPRTTSWRATSRTRLLESGGCTRRPRTWPCCRSCIDRATPAPGEHLLRIHTPERRLSAAQVAERLHGHVPARAGDGDRRRAPGGRAGRRDLLPRRLPLRLGARLGAVPPHPRAAAGQRDAPARRGARGDRPRPRDRRVPVEGGFRQAILDIYVPRYGADWETSFLDSGPVYARIDAERMFTFAMPSA